MNRRKFFSAVAAAVTAALVPARATPIVFDRKGPGYIAARYSSQHAWWRPKYVATLREYQTQSFAELEVRTLATLQSAWKECLAYKTGDTLIIDEQAYEVFKTIRSE